MKLLRIFFLLPLFGLALVFIGCDQMDTLTPTEETDYQSDTVGEKGYEDLIIGFVQLGAESEWRVANTNSIKETAEELGIELRF